MTDRKVFHNSVTPLLTEQGLTPQGMLVQPAKHEHRAEKMTLAFSLGLAPADQTRLEEIVASGRSVAPSALPKPTDPKPLIAWLTGQGFSARPTKGGTLVSASATVAQIEK